MHNGLLCSVSITLTALWLTSNDFKRYKQSRSSPNRIKTGQSANRVYISWDDTIRKSAGREITIFGCPTLISMYINSLSPGRFETNGWLIFQLILMIDGWGISFETALWWLPVDPTDDKSTLVQVMALSRVAPSHHQNQCWPRSMSPYDVTMPQWVW